MMLVRLDVMLWRATRVVVLLLALSQPLEAQALPEATANSTRDGISVENDLMSFLRLALQQAGAPVRLDYSATCPDRRNELIPFPKITIKPPMRGAVGLKAVREIFQREPSTTVDRAANGTIWISIGDIPRALLRARISSLELTPLEQYNPMLAVVAAEKTNDMRLLMAKLGVHPAVVVADYLLNQPGSIAEHLPASVSNVTFDQFLDLIATEFRGVVIYGTCDQPSLFSIQFVPLIRSTAMWPGNGLP
jgi:hypothetical protein